MQMATKNSFLFSFFESLADELRLLLQEPWVESDVSMVD